MYFTTTYSQWVVSKTPAGEYAVHRENGSDRVSTTFSTQIWANGCANVFTAGDRAWAGSLLEGCSLRYQNACITFVSGGNLDNSIRVHNWDVNWIQALALLLLGWPAYVENEKITKLRYLWERFMWGTRGRTQTGAEV